MIDNIHQSSKNIFSSHDSSHQNIFIFPCYSQVPLASSKHLSNFFISTQTFQALVKKWVSIINNSPSRDFITTNSPRNRDFTTTNNQNKVSTTTNQRDFITTSKRASTMISKIRFYKYYYWFNLNQTLRDFITTSVIPPKKLPKKQLQKSTTQLPGKETNMPQR